MRSLGLLVLLMAVAAVAVATVAVAAAASPVVANTASPSGTRVLVVLDDAGIKQSHSQFFGSLQARGFSLTFVEASKPKVALGAYGDYHYDAVILFAPQTALRASLASALVQFVNDGHSVLVAVDSQLTDSMQTLAAAFGVSFDAAGTAVIDHVEHDASDADGNHTLVVADHFLADAGDKRAATAFFGDDGASAPVLFRGVAQVVRASELVTPLLRGSASAYSFVPDREVGTATKRNALLVAGTNTVLVSAVQTRNNGRVVFSGSLELFGNRLWAATALKASAAASASASAVPSGNRRFAVEVSKWLLKERGVLRAVAVEHHLVGATAAPAMYTVTDRIEYAVTLAQWNGSQWLPYSGAGDVQLELVMLDPYVRATLREAPAGSGRYQTADADGLQLPDVYGVFTFQLRYHRRGLSNVDASLVQSIRPFWHSQYERFLVAAYPYYASVAAVAIGTFVFAFFFIFHRE